MRDPSPFADPGLESARTEYERAADELRRQHQVLASLQSTLSAATEENLRLHRRTRALVEALAADVDRMRRQLRRLSMARS